MNRTIIVLLIIAVLLTAGCGVRDIDADNGSAVLETERFTDELNISSENVDAPCLLIFRNRQEIEDFIASPRLNDDEFERLITAKEYIYNGVENKEDARRVIGILSKTFKPESAEYPEISVDIYTKTSHIIVSAHSDTGTSYNFVYYLADNADVQSKLESAAKEHVLTEVQDCEQYNVNALYAADYEGPFHLYYAIKDGVFFAIQAFGFETSESALQAFDFDLEHFAA